MKMFNWFKKKSNKNLYLKAAKIIEERGLNQDGFFVRNAGYDGPVCIIGALTLAKNGEFNDFADIYTDHTIIRDLNKIIFDRNSSDWWPRSIYQWNDHEATKEDVISVLKKAAENS